MRYAYFGLLVLGLAFGRTADAATSAIEFQTITLPPAANMDQAQVVYFKPVAEPVAILVLCPGLDGSGMAMIKDPAWQAFAQTNNLGLMGLDFKSPTIALENNKGYYYVSQGSGDLLLQAVRKAYGQDLPILLYGFSAGAQFASRFVEWKPDRVMTWCADAAGWWDKPLKSDQMPPGIVACGDDDKTRLGASLVYFKQGRKLGKPWLWIDLPKTGHTPSPELEAFARAYFEIILRKETGDGVWVDIDNLQEYHTVKDIEQVSESAWLPDEKLVTQWKKIYVP